MAGPTYVYTANVPQPAQAFNTTQATILSNFQAINELVNVNHGSFNTSNAGKHNFINLQFQSSNPTTASTDLDLYSKSSTDGNIGELFYRYPNSGTVNQLTPTSASGGGGTASATTGTGWCQFPSGVIFRWGNTTQSSNVVYINFPTGSGIPVYKQTVGNAQVANTQSYVSNYSQTQTDSWFNVTSFTLYTNNQSVSTNFNYFTVGL